MKLIVQLENYLYQVKLFSVLKILTNAIEIPWVDIKINDSNNIFILNLKIRENIIYFSTVRN